MLDLGGVPPNISSTSMLLVYIEVCTYPGREPVSTFLIGPGVTETLVTIVKKKESWRCQEFCGWKIWSKKMSFWNLDGFFFVPYVVLVLHYTLWNEQHKHLKRDDWKII